MASDEPNFELMKWIHSLRLRFAYDGGKISLISKVRIKKVPPPSDRLSYKTDESGFWIELRDDKQRVLYRRVMRNPIISEIEIFPEDLDAPIVRRKVDHPQGTFFVIVPDIPQARALVFYSSPSDMKEVFKPARELASFDLVETSEKKEGIQ